MEKTIIRYEIKKVFSQRGGKIALFLLVGLLALCSYFALDISYVNPDGSKIYGVEAARRLREEKHAWAGEVDAEKLRRVVEENNRILATPEGQGNTVLESEITYSRRQNFDDLRDLLNDFYAKGFREYDYYLADHLSPDQVTEDFYENRVKLLREWLADEGSGADFTEKEKAYLIERYEDLDIPLRYDYADGWGQLMEYMPSICMVTAYILAYLVASIFSCEYGLKADSVFFSSAYGRNRAIRGKIAAGVAIVTLVYWGIVLIYTGVVLGCLGADGADCQIQAYFAGWKSLYHLTNLQEYLLVAAGGYIGSLFFSLLTMYVSARTKNAVAAVMVPIFLTFLPSFLGGVQSSLLERVMGLLPDRLLDLHLEVRLFHIYQIGGTVVSALPVLFVLYLALSALLAPEIYRVYGGKFRRDRAV